MFNLPSLQLASSSNCLSCTKYLQCKDKNKSIIYRCSLHNETPESKKSSFLRLQDVNLMPAVSSSTQVFTPSIDEESEYNIYKTIQKVLKKDTLVSPDIKIDDSDFRLAPNFFKFCTSKKYLNEKPYVEQALMGTIIFAEFCPKCSNKRWLNRHNVDDSLEVFQDNVQLLVRGVCPKCKARKSELILNKKLNYYQESAICAGQRSGKSAWLGMMSAYVNHWMLMLQNPNELYGLMNSNILHGTLVALTYAQAKNTLWEPLYGYLLDSPFYTQYHKMLDHYGSVNGEELYRLKDTFVFYRHRRIFIQPSGPDRRTLRGLTRFLASIDELALFDNQANVMKVKINAGEVYKSLGNSLLTVRAAANKLVKKGFDTIPNGYFINISSPYSVRDRMMALVKQSQGSRKIYGLIKPTWEMNPTVSREDLAEEFRNDPIAAMRDFGAQPPLTSNPFIGSRQTVEQCFSDKKNPCEIKYVTKKSKDDTQSRYAYFTKLKSSGHPSILALDAGYSNNSFACSVGHLMGGTYPVIDLLVEVQPLPGIPLNFSLIFTHIIAELIDKRNVKVLVADRWNSRKILDDASLMFDDLLSRQVSIKYPDMQVFKSYLEDKELRIPPPELSLEDLLSYPHSEYPDFFKHCPVSHSVLQLLTIQDTGSAVIKGDQLTDDLARAMMLAHSILINVEYAEYFNLPDEVINIPMDITKMAVYKGYSGGGGSSNRITESSGSSHLGVVRSRQ